MRKFSRLMAKMYALFTNYLQFQAEFHRALSFSYGRPIIEITTLQPDYVKKI